MASDELIVHIRYQADLQSFNNAIAIAERRTGEAVARMAQVIGSLHQPLDAIFESLEELQSAANTITLPNEQVRALQTLTASIADDMGRLNTNLKGVTSTLEELKPALEEALSPLSNLRFDSSPEGSTAQEDLIARLRNAVTFGVAGHQVARPKSKGKAGAAAGVLGLLLPEVLEQLAAITMVQEAYFQMLQNQLRELFQSSVPDSERAFGGPVLAGGSYLVGERGPELFVPRTAGSIISNSELSGGGFGGDLGAGIAGLTAELQRLSAVLQEAGLGEARLMALAGMSGETFGKMQTALTGVQGALDGTRSATDQFREALDLALVDVPEEVRRIAEAVGGTFIGSLEQGRGVMEAMQRAGREAAGQLLHYMLQSESVRGELGELADVIENVLNQATERFIWQ